MNVDFYELVAAASVFVQILIVRTLFFILWLLVAAGCG